MFHLNTLLRKNVQALQPYTVWRDHYLEKPGTVFLDNCENNMGSPIGSGYQRYPSSSQSKLKKQLADFKEVHESQLVLGNGSDEIIDLLIRCFCEPKQDNILICEPTFGMFKIYAQLNAVDVIAVPLNEKTFQFDESRILKSVTPSTKLLFLCSPNNPTGTSIELLQLIAITEQFNGIVVVDEAYIDFSDKTSAISLINELPNLVVLQTFSKAWGLAALRVGVAYSNVLIIELLNKIRPPFNINTHSQQLILNALMKKNKLPGLIRKIIQQKKIIIIELQKLNFVKTIVPGDANFVLLEVTNASELCAYLLSHQILISNRSLLLNCTNYVRISIGTATETQILIEKLKQYGN